jgi:hypothetical protein
MILWIVMKEIMVPVSSASTTMWPNTVDPVFGSILTFMLSWYPALSLVPLGFYIYKSSQQPSDDGYL